MTPSTLTLLAPAFVVARIQVPDLDGISMKMLHRMLDLKRSKCRKLHEQRVAAAKKLARRIQEETKKGAGSGGAEGNDEDGQEREKENGEEGEEEEDEAKWDPNWVLSSDL